MMRSPHSSLSLIALLPVLMLSCQVGTEYEAPELDVPETFRDTESATKVDSLAITQWWDLFQDETLQVHIRTALDQNKDLLLAVSRLREARAILSSTQAAQYPTLDAEAAAEFGRDSRVNSPGATAEDSWELQGVVSWEPDLWGKFASATQAAVAEMLQAQENRNAVLVSLIGDVALRYFELRDLDNQLSIATQTVAARREGLRIAILRFEGGLTAELSVKQSEVELAQAEVEIPHIEREIAANENLLRILMGKNPGEVARGDKLMDYDVPPTVPAGLPSELLTRRPDIRAAEQALVAANARVRVAVADRYPSFSLTGSLGVASNDLSKLMTSDASTWGLELDVIAPIFDAGRRKAEVEISRARLEQSLITYRMTVQEAFREVSDALSDFRRYREIRNRQETLLTATSENERLARIRYIHGYVSLIELLDAQRSLFSAQLELSLSHRNQLLALVRLYRALGGGWDLDSSTDEVMVDPEGS